MKVKLIVKETYQPPIDTPASIRWRTIEVESEELFELINDNTCDYGEQKHKHSTFEVVGAEMINEARNARTD